MALKLTRKGMVLIIVLIAITFFSITGFTAWYLVTDGGNVGFVDSLACGLDPESCDDGGGTSGDSCRGVCSTSGCRLEGDCPDGMHPSAFYCRGRKYSGCNDAMDPYKTNMTGIIKSDEEYWCSTVQADSNAPNGAYIVVYIGDGGKKCAEGNDSCIESLDWDCDDEPVQCNDECGSDDMCSGDLVCSNGRCRNSSCTDETDCTCPTDKPPACLGLTASPTTVTSESQQITVSVSASDQDGTPNIDLFAAAANQTNNNPGNFDCSDNPSSPEYSFYCRGLLSFAPIGERDGTSYSFTTTFRELKNAVNQINSGYTGDLEDKGILITANVTQGGNICSSNIARNNGNGVLYNGGAWDTSCDGGCNSVVRLVEESVPVCNDSCSTNADCPSGLTCSSNRCRNPECTGESDCTCPTPTYVCNDSCTSDSQCPGSLDCINSRCRNPLCSTATNCQCPEPEEVQCNQACNETDKLCPPNLVCDSSSSKCRNPSCTGETDCDCFVPTCGDGDCNQETELCEDNVSCIDGSTVECRSNCKYCGDGIVNGNEQCDPNSGADDGCTEDCLLPSCGDGNLDPGEECEPILTPECTEDCKLPVPPEWEIVKEGFPECVQGKELYADVTYKITVTNVGEGAGDIDKVIDTLDELVGQEWLYTNTVEPPATFVSNVLTWELGVEEQTLQPEEDREFVYQIQVPESGFGSLTNVAELVPVEGESIQITNIENIICDERETPQTGIFDTALGKIGVGLILISISGLYFYFEGTDGFLMRAIYKDEKVKRNRESFERDFDRGE